MRIKLLSKLTYFSIQSKKAIKSVLICPDKFKFSMSAAEVAACIQANLPKDIKSHVITLADGGEGSLDLISQKIKGNWITCDVQDPLMRSIKASYYVSLQNEAYIEMAKASGLALLSQIERNPLKTTTIGTGELILDSIQREHRTIHLLIGGSATNEGGIGMAHALGYEFRDQFDNKLTPVGQNLIKIRRIQHIDSIVRRKFEKTIFKVYTDVVNPLTGPNGASYVYGPQKGGNPKAIEELDKGMSNLNNIFMKQFGRNANQIIGSGAAGGLGAGCAMFLNSQVLRGIDLIFSLTNFDNILPTIDLVITGEGKVDSQTLSGKVVKGVVDRARFQKKSTVVVCAFAEDKHTFMNLYPQIELVELLNEEQRKKIEPILTKSKLCSFVSNYFKG